MKADFNINSRATVILTNKGAKILNDYEYKWPNKEYIEGNTYTTELWSIMNIFGEHCFNGCEIPFKDNIITIDDSNI